MVEKSSYLFQMTTLKVLMEYPKIRKQAAKHLECNEVMRGIMHPAAIT